MNSSVIITAIICVAGISIPIAGIIQDYKLKKEKIKADALVRAEEIKAKNQLEIEKLYLHNNDRPPVRGTDYNDDDNRTSRLNKERL